MSAPGALSMLRRRLLGVALLMTIVLFFSLTVAFYNRTFTSTVDVELRASSSGNQLLPEADVKVRGMVVGRVEKIEPSQQGATLRLSLDPDKARQLPSNVSARLLPRTLFGERYVSLELPERAASARLASGDVIEQDRSRAALELETVLADTMPMLRAVRPDDLAVTLNSLSNALDGRGRQLGQTLSQLNSYVDKLNPSLPDLRANLHELVGVARTYQHAAPDVAEALKNLTTTTRTLAEQRGTLHDLTGQLTTTSGDLRTFLATNEDTLIRLGAAQRPTLDVLAKYSPEFPCFLSEMAKYVPRIRRAFGEGTNEPGLHITLEVAANRGKYLPNQDEPEYADKRGPRCYNVKNMPNPIPEYPPDGPFKDGSVPPPASKSMQGGLLPPSMGEDYLPPAGSTTQSSAGDLGVANSPAERDLVSAIMAPALGTPSEQVPGWGSLLVGPLLRGGEVSYR